MIVAQIKNSLDNLLLKKIGLEKFAQFSIENKYISF